MREVVIAMIATGTLCGLGFFLGRISAWQTPKVWKSADAKAVAEACAKVCESRARSLREDSNDILAALEGR